jgi:hypothetical protein
MAQSQDAKIRAVAVQSLLYVIAFFATYIWTIGLRFMESYCIHENDEAAIFPLLLLQAFFLPMFGFFNVLVYIRPRYLQVRGRFPNETRRRALRRVIFGEPPSPLAEANIRTEQYRDGVVEEEVAQIEVINDMSERTETLAVSSVSFNFEFDDILPPKEEEDAPAAALSPQEEGDDAAIPPQEEEDDDNR